MDETKRGGTHHEADGEDRHELGDHFDPQEDADPAQPEDERRDLARERVEAAEGEDAANEDVHDVARREGGERQRELAVVAEGLTREAADFWVDAEQADVSAEADGDEDVTAARESEGSW